MAAAGPVRRMEFLYILDFPCGLGVAFNKTHVLLQHNSDSMHLSHSDFLKLLHITSYVKDYLENDDRSVFQPGRYFKLTKYFHLSFSTLEPELEKVTCTTDEILVDHSMKLPLAAWRCMCRDIAMVTEILYYVNPDLDTESNCQVSSTT